MKFRRNINFPRKIYILVYLYNLPLLKLQTVSIYIQDTNRWVLTVKWTKWTHRSPCCRIIKALQMAPTDCVLKKRMTNMKLFKLRLQPNEAASNSPFWFISLLFHELFYSNFQLKKYHNLAFRTPMLSFI